MKVYEIIFDKKALQYLKRLPKAIAKRIWNKLQETKAKPHQFFEKLSSHKTHKLRVGQYRVIADINNKKLQILVVYINHRRKVYKKLP